MKNGSARDLRRAASHFLGPPHLPRLWFFTDPLRTPEPWEIADALPAGAAVVFRHFGLVNRDAVSRRLLRTCRRRSARLLIGADWMLAERIGADGVHLPERMAAKAGDLKRRRPDWVVSVAAHSEHAVRTPADAAILSPIYRSRSASAGRPLGLQRATRILQASASPVIALGGIHLERVPELARAGFAGAAGIDLFLE